MDPNTSIAEIKSEQFYLKIVGVSDFGQLQLEDKTGKIQECMFKEVEFVF